MKHILDYPTLKEWGFVWGAKGALSGKELTVITYIREHGDTHLSIAPNFLIENCWALTSEGTTLFKGQIPDKASLETILKCCLISPNQSFQNH